MTDVRGSHESRVKLVRVAKTTTQRRSRVALDPAITEVRSVYRFEGSDAPLLSTGTINVKLKTRLTPAEVEQLWTDHGLEIVQPVEGLQRVFVVRSVHDGEDEVLRAELLADDLRTEWAEPNFRVPTHKRQITPQDPYFNYQWHLNNTGQGGGKANADIDALNAWLQADGQDILMGMFDDACDVDHEDLRENYIGEGQDPSLQSTSPGYDDPRPKAQGDYHGTAVMGLAVAAGNTIGGRGVAYKSRFTASRGLGDIFLSDAAAALVYTFALQQEVDVHINSWGYDFSVLTPAIMEDAIEAAFREGRDRDGPEGDGTTNYPPRGMVIVFASGNGINNEGPGVEVEAGRDLSTLPTVIGIGASSYLDELASYSNYGPEIDVLAPGG
ncbi:MAG: S8 family serine peptidase, partial [Phycisphaerales bacterium]